MNETTDDATTNPDAWRDATAIAALAMIGAGTWGVHGWARALIVVGALLLVICIFGVVLDLRRTSSEPRN